MKYFRTLDDLLVLKLSAPNEVKDGYLVGFSMETNNKLSEGIRGELFIIKEVKY